MRGERMRSQYAFHPLNTHVGQWTILAPHVSGKIRCAHINIEEEEFLALPKFELLDCAPEHPYAVEFRGDFPESAMGSLLGVVSTAIRVSFNRCSKEFIERIVPAAVNAHDLKFTECRLPENLSLTRISSVSVIRSHAPENPTFHGFTGTLTADLELGWPAILSLASNARRCFLNANHQDVDSHMATSLCDTSVTHLSITEGGFGLETVQLFLSRQLERLQLSGNVATEANAEAAATGQFLKCDFGNLEFESGRTLTRVLRSVQSIEDLVLPGLVLDDSLLHEIARVAVKTLSIYQCSALRLRQADVCPEVASLLLTNAERKNPQIARLFPNAELVAMSW